MRTRTPSAISTFADFSQACAVKLLNPSAAAAYSDAVDRHGRRHERVFRYEPVDLEILYMTRKLALLGFDRSAYRRLFASDPLDDFPAELGTLEKAGLLDVDDERVALTPTGMFYADTVAGMKRRGDGVPTAAPVVFHLYRYDAAHHGMG